MVDIHSETAEIRRGK